MNDDYVVTWQDGFIVLRVYSPGMKPQIVKPILVAGFNTTFVLMPKELEPDAGIQKFRRLIAVA